MSLMPKMTLALLMPSLLLVSACRTSSGPDVIIETNADELQRATYSQAQIDAYKDALKFEVQRIPRPDGMELDFDVPDEDWDPFIVRAKALCDDARADGWDQAQVTYQEQLREQFINSLPAEIVDSEGAGEVFDREGAPLVAAQLRAAAAPGSLCPELAPEGFGTVITNEVPVSTEPPTSAGTYYGEGCEGSVNALGEILEALPQVENLTISPSDFYDLLIEVGGALIFGQYTEPDKAAAGAMAEAAYAVTDFASAIDARDPEASAEAQTQVAEAAIEVLDACEAAYSS